MRNIIGIDLSLRATGMAVWNESSGLSLFLIESSKADMERLDDIFRHIKDLIPDPTSLVLIEGLALMSKNGKANERAGLWYMVAHWLWKRQQPYLAVAPARAKKFLTGRGNAKKDEILKEVYKRYGVDLTDDNLADALNLCQIGRAIDGHRKPSNKQQQEVVKALSAQLDLPTVAAAG